MEKNNIGVCVIGVGRAGMIHARNFARSVANVKLVAVADPFEEAARKACHELELTTYYRDYHEALQDERVDAVVVVSPTVYHKEIVVVAAQAGKHILCEKPMAMTVAECDEMIEAVEHNQVKLQIGFMRRFDKSFMYAKERIVNGDIGDVVLLRYIGLVIK